MKKDINQEDLILYLHGASAFQLLHAGTELGVFELLNKDKSSIEEMSKMTKLKIEPLRTLLFGLTALGLIKQSNEFYKNSQIIEKLFKENEWKLFKSMIMIQAHIMYLGQIDYVESLKQNKNVGLSRFNGSGKTIYEKLDKDLKLKEIFYTYMEEYSNYANPHLIKNINLSKDKSILDVGGGGGGNAIALAKSNPHINITLLDLPVAKNIAENKISKSGLSDRIKFHSGDMFNDKFPNNFDSIFFIHQLVIWSQEENRLLLKKAYESLNENGKVIIFSSISDDNEDGPLMAALDTVYFRSIAAGNGMIYPWKDYEKLLKEAGFSRVEKIKCETWTPHGIIIGYK